MKKKMHIKYDLSGNKKNDIIECLIKDNIISYFDEDYKMKIDLINQKIYRENNDINYEIDFNKEKIVINYGHYSFDKRIKIIEKNIDNSSISVKYLLVDENLVNFYEIK